MEIRPADIGRHVVCKACNRVVIPIAAAPQVAVTGARQGNGSFKDCPFCSERIFTSAVKCRHCGEFLRSADGSEPHNGDGPKAESADGGTISADADAPQPEFVFRVSTSQWDNFFKYVICAVILIISAGVYLIPTVRPYAGIIFGSVLLVDCLAVFLIYSGTRSSRCFVGPERIELHSGIFTRQIDWISLTSIQDMQLRQGAIERALNIGTITIKSMDQTTPMLEFYQIPKARKLFTYMQEQVARHKRRPK